MNFTISRNDFSKALTKVKGIPVKSATVPILNHLLLTTEGESIVITALDTDIWIRVEAKAQVFDEGSIALPAEPFFRIIGKLPDETVLVELQENDRVRITCGNARFNLSGLSAEEYPKPPDDTEEETFTVPSKTLKRMIEKTVFAASKEEYRYNMSGVRTEIFGENGNKTIRMVATDGRRLAISDTESTNGVPVLDEGITIPLKGCFALLRMARESKDEIELSIKGNSLTASKDNEKITIRLIGEDFPDYKRVIGDGEGKILSSNRKALKESLERILIMADGMSKLVLFNITGDDCLEIRASNNDLGDAEEHLSVQSDVEEMTVGFNAEYLLECLGAMESKEVKITLKDESSPALITGDNDEGFKCVVMPISIS